jgi:hypothetical protein
MCINWTERLKEVIPYPCCDYRPFVCRNEKNGFPDAHAVIIIGEEEKTKLETNWWNFWNPESAFDYKRFETYYLEYRRKIGKSGESRTRTCLDLIHENGINAVETNASHAKVVKLLIENMPLKAIVAYGVPAKKLVSDLQFQRVITLPDARVIRETHFSRGFSFRGRDSDLERLCDKITLIL